MPGKMVPRAEKSQLKRGRGTEGEGDQDPKKFRRSQRLHSQQHTPVSTKQYLPSPVTHQDSTSSNEAYKEGTVTPTEGRPSQIAHRAQEVDSPTQGNNISSPPQDTQAFSQFVPPLQSLAEEVRDEAQEGVWGYLMPLDSKHGKVLVLKKRSACPLPDSGAPLSEDTPKGNKTVPMKPKDFKKEEQAYEETKLRCIASGGYLIGRHPECDLKVDDASVSNRHCLIFSEMKGGEPIAVVEDLSSNGTFVNEALIGRNKRRELKDNDEIQILDQSRFVFRYPKNRGGSAFFQQYTLLEKLGKGHFAEVFLCVEKSTGQRYAVKIFTKRSGVEERSKTEGLQQEIAVLMGVSHPNMLCLKDTFDEPNAVYLVLELACEGELFNWIIMKSKLSEGETRKVFIQLFQGIKYLHDRNIVHRDIKPENILLTDKNLHVKVADFGLAKIIGEESFTTTLCGTPSYVAPEILEESRRRRYTRAVDIWSLGVVLYICLCGFPPFSDELYSPENPYTLTQQIKEGRFDYPSPYWDPVSDAALDLIDRMLTVDVDKRYTVDECLAHPWTMTKELNVNDSTDGLVGHMADLDFTRRKVVRERTLLSALNDVKVARVISLQPDKDPIKIYSKNPAHEAKNGNGNGNNGENGVAAEAAPAANRKPGEFMEMGGKGDEELYGYDGGSIYSKVEATTSPSAKNKGTTAPS